MSVIPVKSFSGMVPRVPAHLLQPNQAQSAFDCDFTHGELRPLKAPFFIKSLSNSAKGLYTEDGLVFFSWPQDVNVFRSPIVDDGHNRIYYSGVNGDTLIGQLVTGARVTTAAGMLGTGGVPPTDSDFLIGVPRPVALPNIYTTDLTTIPGVEHASLSINFWYESDGKRFQYTENFPREEVVPLRRYQITVPEQTTTTVNASNPITGVYMETVTYASSGTSGQDGNVAPTNYTTSTVQTTVTVLNASSVQTSGGTIYTGVVHYTDQSGVLHMLSDLVTGVTQGTGDPSTSTSTPPSGTPQVEIVVTNTDTQELVYRASTSNNGRDSSSLKGNVSVTMQKLEGVPGVYEIVITYGTAETRAYIYTYVNLWGEESAPSDAVIANVTAMQSVVVACSVTQPTGYKPYGRIRVYRSNTSSQGVTQYQFVGEQTVDSGVDAIYDFTDIATGSELGEVCPSDLWDCPPSSLTNLTLLPNGVFAASWGNEIRFSVPYRPWAWPEAWAITLRNSVTGMLPLGNSLLVTTTAYPSLINGAHPDSFIESRVPLAQAGVAQRSMVDLGSAVAYVSHDGIVMVRGNQGGIDASQKFWTREDWRAAYGPTTGNLASVRLMGFEGRIMGLRPASNNGFLLDIEEGGGAMSQVRTYVNGAFILPETDQCYITDTSGRLYQLFGGDSGSYVWHSKDFIVDRPTNFGALQLILGGSGTVTYTVYADGVARSTGTVTASGIVRLTSGFRARRWSVKLEGTAIVREMYLATIPQELMNV